MSLFFTKGENRVSCDVPSMQKHWLGVAKWEREEKLSIITRKSAEVSSKWMLMRGYIQTAEKAKSNKWPFYYAYYGEVHCHKLLNRTKQRDFFTSIWNPAEDLLGGNTQAQFGILLLTPTSVARFFLSNKSFYLLLCYTSLCSLLFPNFSLTTSHDCWL